MNGFLLLRNGVVADLKDACDSSSMAPSELNDRYLSITSKLLPIRVILLRIWERRSYEGSNDVGRLDSLILHDFFLSSILIIILISSI